MRPAAFSALFVGLIVGIGSMAIGRLRLTPARALQPRGAWPDVAGNFAL
jgi:hypothetical protein